jgi:FkbH-like protein
MVQRAENGLKQWIAAAEMALFAGDDDRPAERFSWLATGLLRRSPDKLWDLLREAGTEDLEEIPGLEGLLDALGQRLVAAGRLGEAEDLVKAARRWEVRLAGSVYRQLAEAQARSGEVTRAEETVREVVKRDTADLEALQVLYRVLRGTGRIAEAGDVLNRLVELDPSAATTTFVYRERSKLGDASGRPVRIALISTYVLDPLIPFLDAECRRAGLAPAFYVTPFNQYTQDVLNSSSSLYSFGPEIAFMALDPEDLYPALRGVPSIDELAMSREQIRSTIASLVRELRSRCDALIVVHELTFTGWSPHGILDNRRGEGLARWTEDVNRDLADEFASQPHTFLLPLRHVLSRAGTAQGQSRKLHYMARMRYTDAALLELARYSMRYVKPLKGLTRKCVVVDLDGTLWGGVVGEVGPEGIQLGPTVPGAEYVDFQQALLNLTKRGILLAICSKNNTDDVMPVLREHKHMVLREEHFSAIRINWRNKAENLAEIADELNIGLDTLVFLDDNPAERALVRQFLPEVLTVELPRDASQLRSTLEELTDFELLALTREDELRVDQYQANRRRQALERTSASLNAYLHSLEIKADIGRAGQHHVPRLVQMFNKTNQFNSTTRRYQTQEMSRFVTSSGHRVYVLEVADRFGEHGLVGAAIVRDEGETWYIDSFLLSCRVMGLSVETALLKRIYDGARAHNVQRLVGEFIATAKNGPTADFYGRHGFRLDGDVNGTQSWILDPSVERVEDPDWIAVKVTSE